MGCGVSHIIKACELAPKDIHKHFTGKIRSGFSFDGFSASVALIKEYELSSLLSPEEKKGASPNGRISMDKAVENVFINKLVNYLKTTPTPTFTMREEMWITSQLARSFVAHILQAPHEYPNYSQEVLSMTNTVSFDNEYFKTLALKITAMPNAAPLNLDTQDSGIVDALNIRLAREVLNAAGTYPDAQIGVIFQKLQMDKANTNAQTDLQRVNAIAFAKG